MVAYFFSQMLNVVRFNILPEMEWSIEEYGQESHNFNFKYYGYRSLFLVANLNYIPVYAGIIVLLYIAALVKDSLRLTSCFT